VNSDPTNLGQMISGIDFRETEIEFYILGLFVDFPA
jgi:hypothetical protein